MLHLSELWGLGTVHNSAEKSLLISKSLQRQNGKVSMTSNVRALNLTKSLKVADISRPERADVEDAFRTIIRWAGDDPARPGLIETPASPVLSRNFSVATVRIPPRFCNGRSKKSKAMTS
jgi:GTP cyclohydrolase I